MTYGIMLLLALRSGCVHSVASTTYTTPYDTSQVHYPAWKSIVWTNWSSCRRSSTQSTWRPTGIAGHCGHWWADEPQSGGRQS